MNNCTTNITLCEGPAHFEGRACGEYLVISFPQSHGGLMLSRNDALKLAVSLKERVWDDFGTPQAKVIGMPLIVGNAPAEVEL